MYNYGIVGDIHIAPSVSSRVDDYFATCLKKISEVANNCKNVIILGDVFNTPSIQNNYFVELYNTLSYFNGRGVSFYSIIGNHDIYNEREDSLNRTSLGLADATGIIKLITVDNPITIGNYRFNTSYVNYNRAITHLDTMTYGENDILLLHHFHNDGFDGIDQNLLEKTKIKHVFFGHEHNSFEQGLIKYPNLTAYRCGSLLRNAANDYNLVRDIFYYVFDDINEIKGCTVDCAQPASSVFTQKAYTRENYLKKEFLSNVNEVVDKYSAKISEQEKFSIVSILRELQTPEENFNYIRTKYELIGERFN